MMIKKSMTLIFSIAFITMGTFSVHAMEKAGEIEKCANIEKATKRPSRIPLKVPRDDISERYRRQPCIPLQKKTITLNEFDVTPAEYEDVVSFYAIRLNQGNFKTLITLFTKIPVEKRIDALKDLELRINARNFRPMFDKYHFLPDGIVTDSPMKPKNAKILIEMLLQLPYEPIEV